MERRDDSPVFHTVKARVPIRPESYLHHVVQPQLGPRQETADREPQSHVLSTFSVANSGSVVLATSLVPESHVRRRDRIGGMLVPVMHPWVI